MIQEKSKEFKAFFLLEFTKELIKQHSGEIEILKLKNILHEKHLEEQEAKKREKEKINEIIKEREKQLQTEKIFPQRTKEINYPPRTIAQTTPLRPLFIPEPKLPPRLQYLKPTPTSNEIDLEKLNEFVKDPMVNSIECNGSDENIVVRGNMGIKKTNAILNKEEIDDIIKRFSENAKIPVQEGIFKVAVGRLTMTAIISEVIGSKFIIKKITQPKIGQGQYGR